MINFLKKNNRKVFRIETWGGVGDGLANTPSFKALKETYPDCKIIVYCIRWYFKEIYANNPYIDSIVNIKIWQLEILKKFVKVYDTHFQAIPPTFLKTTKHGKEIVADILGVKLNDHRVQVYLTEKEKSDALHIMSKYKNPICIHVTSRNSKYHMWAPEKWEELIRRMPEYTFIQLGQKDEYHVKGAVDFLGKTSLRGAIAMMTHAQYFVGTDGGLAHAANSAKIPAIVLFSDSDVNTHGHKEHINIYYKMPCAPCYFLLWGQDGCPYDSACIKKITVEDVQNIILKVESQKMGHSSIPTLEN
ncbi:MAG: glycosyltransferase family 9 protein [Arcicella sp.]|jgi:ADP-heptose:LPS heptosyltransferase|nr:glycosyltransferase family 9 protein [Arcicella sp.]